MVSALIGISRDRASEASRAPAKPDKGRMPGFAVGTRAKGR